MHFHIISSDLNNLVSVIEKNVSAYLFLLEKYVKEENFVVNLLTSLFLISRKLMIQYPFSTFPPNSTDLVFAV